MDLRRAQQMADRSARRRSRHVHVLRGPAAREAARRRDRLSRYALKEPSPAAEGCRNRPKPIALQTAADEQQQGRFTEYVTAHGAREHRARIYRRRRYGGSPPNVIGPPGQPAL